MKRKVPRFRRKVQGIPGDCMLPGLGLTSADKTTLVKNVSQKTVPNRSTDISHVNSFEFVGDETGEYRVPYGGHGTFR